MKVKITNKVLKSWIKDLYCNGYFACQGSIKPYESMATCINCQLVKDMRYYLDGKPRLPEHKGYK